MRMLLAFFALCLLALPTMAEESAARFIELTAADGRKIEAEIVRKVNEDPSTYRIRRRDGSEFDVKIADLDGDSVYRIALEMERKKSGVPADFESIWVTCTAVKNIGGKFRYFLHFRNFSEVPFAGTVTVTLQNAMAGVTNGSETFGAGEPLDPGMGQTGWIDAHTGPRSVHADASVVGIQWITSEAGKFPAKGQSAVPEVIVE